MSQHLTARLPMNRFVQHFLEKQVFAASNYILKVCDEEFEHSTTCKTESNTQVKLFILVQILSFPDQLLEANLDDHGLFSVRQEYEDLCETTDKQMCHTEHDQVLQRKLSTVCAQAKPSLLHVTSSLPSYGIKNTARSARLKYSAEKHCTSTKQWELWVHMPVKNCKEVPNTKCWTTPQEDFRSALWSLTPSASKCLPRRASNCPNSAASLSPIKCE